MTLADELKNSVLLMDGAMGTYLQSRGLARGTPSCLWVIEKAVEVKKAHQEYADAGARILLANTFYASRDVLQKYGYADRLSELHQKAVEIVRDAAPGVFVAGDLGPMAPDDALAVESYREAVEILVGQGVDLLAFETMTSHAGIQAALAAISSLRKPTPILVSMTINRWGLLPSGEDPLAVLPLLEGHGVDLVGLNCSEGPDKVYEVLSRMKDETDLPLAAKPNAGLPPSPPMSPDEFAGWGKKFLGLGVKMIGGCCGTTPQHILALKAALE